MDKLVSISSNNTPKYLYYIPLVKWAWGKFGWETFISFVGMETKCSMLVEEIIDGFDWYPEEHISFSSGTIAQTCRLYASKQWPQDHLMMLSDVDMIPLSDYWHPEENEITCYGRNLSNEHQPICYVCMPKKDWAKMMMTEKETSNEAMFRDLNKWYPNARNKWTVDQQILTDRIEMYDHQIRHIHRGTNAKTGYPWGRVDRSGWTLDHTNFIDCHLPHDILTNEKSFHKVMELLHHVWPGEDFKWFVSYHKEFKKLL